MPRNREATLFVLLNRFSAQDVAGRPSTCVPFCACPPAQNGPRHPPSGNPFMARRSMAENFTGFWPYALDFATL